MKKKYIYIVNQKGNVVKNRVYKNWFVKWAAENVLPNVIWAFFCFCVGVTFSGITLAKLMEKLPANYEGPIISKNILYAYLIGTNKESKILLLQITLIMALLGIELMYGVSQYYLEKKTIFKNIFVPTIIYLLVGIAIVLLLTNVLTDGTLLNSTKGIYKVFFAISLSNGFAFWGVAVVVKSLYKWLLDESGKIDIRKLGIYVTIIIAIIGWRVVR